MDSYTVNCLEKLVQIIASDEDVCRYFSELPGVTYQFARYTDWIKPYLLHQLSINKTSSTYHSDMRTTIESVLKAYVTYEKYLAKTDGVPFEEDQK